MGEIATSKRQITLFYNINSIRAKKTLAFARAKGFPIQEINLLKVKLTGTQIAEIADKLNLDIKDLINQEHPAYSSLYKPHDLDENDWIKMIRHHPEILKQPIALRGDRAILVETPTDIIKF